MNISEKKLPSIVCAAGVFFPPPSTEHDLASRLLLPFPHLAAPAHPSRDPTGGSSISLASRPHAADRHSRPPVGAHPSTKLTTWTPRPLLHFPHLAAAGSRQSLAPTRQRIRRRSGRDTRSTSARVHRDYPHEDKLLLCPSSGGTPRVLRLILSPYSLDCWWSTSAHEPFDRSK
jgi:hypothetical protein